MKNGRFWLAAVLLCVAGWCGEASAEGYFERYYESFWYHPRYQHEYHGYWRDLGYGFTNRPVYGGYYRGERSINAPFYGLPHPERIYSVPSGPYRRR
jgi:hypothetical protein